ncbi:MAG TPA: glycosyltransferase family 4 protein [Anaerolineae bacterium]
MRILTLSWEYPPYVVGGLGAHVAALAPALARQGVEMDVITPRWKGGEAREVIGPSGVASVMIHRIDPPMKQITNFFADTQATNIYLEQYAHELVAERGGYDIIHVHDWLVAFAGVALKHLHKTPLLATIHATERGRGQGSVAGEMAQAINGTEWWLTYESWRIITASFYMLDQVKSYFGVPADKIDVIPNGVETLPFDALDGLDLSDFRKQWALPSERIVYFVGRMQHEKGAHLIVEAAPRILAEFPQAKFVLAGTGSMVEPLRARTNELGLNGKVLVAGFVSDQARDELFKIADVAVFPSLYEPFGIVALQAMAAKCPVVVSAVGGLTEVVKNHETGITVYPDNLDSLVWGILHTLQHPDWARARAENAYRAAREEFNWDLIAQKTRRVYERITDERRRIVW